MILAAVVSATAFALVVPNASAAPRNAILSGDIIVSNGIAGGCPTYKGILDVLMAALENRPGHDVAIADGCQRLEPGVALTVGALREGDVLLAQAPSGQWLYVWKGDFRKIGHASR